MMRGSGAVMLGCCPQRRAACGIADVGREPLGSAEGYRRMGIEVIELCEIWFVTRPQRNSAEFNSSESASAGTRDALSMASGWAGRTKQDESEWLAFAHPSEPDWVCGQNAN